MRHHVDVAICMHDPFRSPRHCECPFSWICIHQTPQLTRGRRLAVTDTVRIDLPCCWIGGLKVQVKRRHLPFSPPSPLEDSSQFPRRIKRT